MGLFGGSKSSSNVVNDTSQHNVTGGNDSQNLHMLAGSGKNSKTNISMLDAGAIAASFDAIDKADARNQTSFSSLLDASRDIFTRSADAIQDAYKSGASTAGAAYSEAAAYKAGGFDQKTILILAVIGALALVAVTRKKG